MKIGVITAMDKEFSAIEGFLSEHETIQQNGFAYGVGILRKNEIVLTKSGIGKVNAALGANELIRKFKPDVVVSTGVAGGLNSDFAKVMDIVVGSQMVYHDVDCGPGNQFGQIQGMPPVYYGDEKLLSVASALDEQAGAREGKIVAGQIVTGDCFVTTEEQTEKIRVNFPNAVAVDMESTAIAQTCYLHKVPFISFRIVSDIPGEENHFAKYTDFWDRMAASSFQNVYAFLCRVGGARTA